MPDLLDQIADQHEQKAAGGDLLDQIADKLDNPVDKAIASVPRPEGPDTGILAAHGITSADNEPQGASEAGLQRMLPHSAKDVARGAINVVTGAEPGAETGLLPEVGTHAVSGATRLATPGQRLGGAAELIGAAGEAAAPLMGLGGIEAGAIPAAKGLATGLAAGQGAKAITKAAGGGEQAQELAEEAGTWIPIAGATLDPRIGIESTPEGTRASATVLGGKAGAGVAVTPEGTTIRGKAGPFEGSTTFGGKAAPKGQTIEGEGRIAPEGNLPPAPAPSDEVAPTPPAPSPASPVLVREGAEAAVKAAQKEAIAKAIVNPGPPVPPPAPPPPPPDKHLPPDEVQKIADHIESLPPEQQPQAISEAHDALTKEIASSGGKIVTPDNKVVIVKNPDQASTVAAKIINDEIGRRDKEAKAQAKDVGKQSAPVSVEPGTPGAGTEVAKGPSDLGNGAAANPPNSGGAGDLLDQIAASPQKGDRVTLPDGRPGTVTFTHPKMSIARVKPDDGSSMVSTGIKGLKPIQNASGAPAKPEVAQTSTPAPTASPAGGKVAPERRQNLTERKRVEHMSPEEMKNELLRSHVVDLPNRRAFDESEKAPSVAMSDADGLKAINDKFGYEAGNELLKAKAEALKEAGLDAYHEKGDEFLYRGESPEALQSGLEKARGILRDRTIEVKLKDGTVRRFKGADFSYGTGKELDHAESALKAHKSEREARGERARGELRGITETPEGSSAVSKGPAEEVKPPEKIDYSKGLAEATPNREKFQRTYQRHLERMIDLYPETYRYPKSEAPKVAEKMTASFEKGSANKDSPAVRATLKELGIKNTYEAIRGYLKAQPDAHSEATLASHLQDKIASGAMPKDNPALRKLVEAFDKKPAEPARMKQAQEALEVATVQHARSIVAAGGDDQATFDKLVDLYDSQPNLNIRTSTSIENQAYSTPAPLAFVASKLAGIDGSAKVYEPTAGNGMLLIGADPKNTTANELNPDRIEGLKAQGFKPTQGDALKASVPEKSQDSVITNPPFGSVKDETGTATKVRVDGYKIGQIDHLISARALDTLKDNGTATLILGANKFTAGAQSTDDGIFLNWLYSHYNVDGHFEVDGKLYGRQGAAWPVRVITINGRQASSAIAPPVGSIQRVGTWTDAYDKSRQILAARASTPREPGANDTLQRQPANEPRPVRSEPGTAAHGTNQGEPLAGAESSHQQSGAPAGPVRDSHPEQHGGVAVSDPRVRPDADIARSDKLEQGHKPESVTERAPDAGRDRASLNPVSQKANDFQAPYTPTSHKKDVGVLIPVNMRQPLEQAMNTLQDEVGDLDKFVAKELGYDSTKDLHDAFMGLQVDSIAASIREIQTGKAVVIADQTGIGKGRQAAAIIRWAAKNGHIPVFVTKAPSLFTDMYGDLSDIGSDDINPFIMNADEWITRPDGSRAFANKLGTHRKTIEQIRNTGNLPADRNAVFLTYSQINVPNAQQQMLSSLSRKAVFILDESHNAGGDSNTGDFLRGVLQDAKGVTYLSATYAKRPDNMPLYFKTDIGTAVGDSGTLIQAMKDGGLPLQTVVSHNLVKAGQMFRRERSYDGVSMVTKVDTEHRAEHTKLADKATEALRAITDADKAFHSTYVKHAQKEAAAENKANKIAGGGNEASKMVHHTEFSSVVHNFVRQMLLGIKANTAAEAAIAAIKRGEKPIIAVDNTMGSFLSAYVGEKNLADGDPLDHFDYRTVLSRALDRSRYLQITNAQGDKTKVYVPLSELDPETRAAYAEAQRTIDKIEVNLPVSPIDWMRNQLEEAGNSVAEITGRSLAVDYTDPDNPKLSHVPTQEQNDKVETTRRFNDGRLDALILNIAGSTGISLHASEKFSDQRPRHMIIAQAAQDINIFMQMLGRIHRTGQVKLPGYTILNADLPAEKRPTALLSKKMKSLNANTSSNTESATSVQAADMLNKYGDQIIGTYLDDNPKLADMLDVDPVNEDGSPTEDIARKATGRLAILPVKVQEEFYRDVEQQYNDYIAYLDSTNQNELEPKTFDYDARETKSATLVEATNPNTPFGDAAIYGEYSIKSQGKPLTPAEVTETIKENLGGKTGEQHAAALTEKLNGELMYYKQTLDPTGPMVGHADQVARSARQFIHEHPIGTTLRVEINGEVYSAAITNLRSTHKTTGNPFAFSKINVTIATNGALRSLNVPATQLQRIETAKLWQDPESIFRGKAAETRETAKIITGNLLAAYGELTATRGTIINFTKQDGTTEQGILLPKKFDFKENTKGDYRLRDADHAIKFLRKSLNPRIEDIGIASRDGNVRVVNDAGKLAIVTPKSKARGGKYFLDHAITDITGDFVSQQNTMRVDIPKGKEAQAIEQVMRKAALYASPSMADEARDFGPKEEKESFAKQLVSNESGEFRPGVLGDAAKTFVGQDIIPGVSAVTKGMKAGAASFVRTFYPRIAETNPIGKALGIAAPTDAVDALMEMKGDRQRNQDEFTQVMNPARKEFQKRSEDANIDAITRAQTGDKQDDAKLQAAMDDLQQILNTQRSQEEAARNLGRRGQHIELARKENYFPNNWKVKPGSGGEEETPLERIEQIARPRRPLEGSQRYNKKQSYTLAEGVEAGGVPYSTNPIDVVERRLQDGMMYVTATRMFDRMKKLDLLQFVRKGAKPPEGFAKIPDPIAKVFLPVDVLYPGAEESKVKPIETGEYYGEANTVRLLTNFLSRDYIREHPLGRGLMFLKNAGTAIELSFSPFHAIFESVEAMSSAAALGTSRFVNIGLRQGKPEAALEGLKEVFASPAAPITLARLGAGIPAYVAARSALSKIGVTQFGKTISGTQPHGVKEALAQYNELRKEKSIQRLVKRFPNIDDLIDDLFTGGLQIGQHVDYQAKVLGETPGESLRAGNPLGAMMRAVLGIPQTVMYPLFQVYIPALKWGTGLREMAYALEDHGKDIESGKMTRAEVARQVVDSVENRFGELNFDNLFWDRTFKSAMQFMFRSVTWKGGTLRQFGSAAGGQLRDAAQWAEEAYNSARGKGDDEKTWGEKAIPHLDPRASWVFSLWAYSVLIGSIASKILTGKYPWEYAKDLASLYTETVHPRTGETDRHGKPVRLGLPTYIKEIESARNNPFGYAMGSMSSLMSDGIDVAKNRDYFDNYVYNPNAGLTTKIRQSAEHMAPRSFALSNFERSKETGQGKTAILSAFGFPRAPKDIDWTPLEKQLNGIIKSKRTPLTPEELEAMDKRRAAHDNGTMSTRDRRNYEKYQRETFLEQMLKNKELKYPDLLEAAKVASPEEKHLVERALRAKRETMMKSSGIGAVRDAEKSSE
jgi:GGDEF domain-containing protein